MKLAVRVALASLSLGFLSCGHIQIPPCILDGSCLPTPPPTPSPSPTPPVPSPSVAPSSPPSPSPSPVPSPSPSSTPSPSPVPSPTPSATPSPVPSPGIPPEGVCPEGWPTVPTRMGLGQVPLGVNRRHSNDEGFWTVYVLNSTPRQEPPYCPHRGNLGECEMWTPCATQPGYEPDARQTLPGHFVDEPVERRSFNPYLLVVVISENPTIGSPPGHYTVCVAPTKAQRNTAAETCREYDFTDR